MTTSARAPASLASVSMSNPSFRTRSPTVVESDTFEHEQFNSKIVNDSENTHQHQHEPKSVSFGDEPRIMGLDQHHHKDSFEYSCGGEVRFYVPGSEEEKKLVRQIDLHM